jgi:hypothetical protein
MIESVRPTGAAGPSVVAALKAASSATGADFDFLVRTAARESGFDASAKAKTSSATGLFQFTEGTWLSMIDRYGGRHGVDAAGLSRKDILALRTDANLSARMAGELARENAGLLQTKLGRTPTSGELYIAHFLGPADAAKLIEAVRAGDKRPVAELFPAAAAANAGVFGLNRQTPMSASDLYANLTRAEQGRSLTPAAPAPGPDAAAPVSEHAAARLVGAELASSLLSALLDVQAEEPDRFLFES